MDALMDTCRHCGAEQPPLDPDVLDPDAPRSRFSFVALAFGVLCFLPLLPDDGMLFGSFGVVFAYVSYLRSEPLWKLGLLTATVGLFVGEASQILVLKQPLVLPIPCRSYCGSWP